ncbi:YWFCY domain-containing protein [Pedobacter endophyticus]|nr:YWFCY domain-containing protein [Pedobacter endophyticus]
MRAVSILLVLMHLYWFCYGFFFTTWLDVRSNQQDIGQFRPVRWLAKRQKVFWKGLVKYYRNAKV